MEEDARRRIPGLQTELGAPAPVRDAQALAPSLEPLSEVEDLPAIAVELLCAAHPGVWVWALLGCRACLRVLEAPVPVPSEEGPSRSLSFVGALGEVIDCAGFLHFVQFLNVAVCLTEKLCCGHVGLGLMRKLRPLLAALVPSFFE
eukprot:7855678-Alexandrium_andersonii.AAC.1